MSIHIAWHRTQISSNGFIRGNIHPSRIVYQFLTIFLIFGIFTYSVQATALDDYVAAPDSNYAFPQEGSSVIDWSTFTTGYTLKLTSQQWRDPSEVGPDIWKHWVTIYKPFNFLITTDTALLLINGGSHLDPAPAYEDQFRLMAAATGSVIAVISAVPNQPLLFTDEATSRSEDEIIAYSWDKYLRGGDANWPAQLPMVKSVVRGMNAIQEFLAGLGSLNQVTINNFVLTGGSKRGWTAWLTAAVDARVTAVAPIVSDLLNMKRSFAHHWAAYGFWADALSPYEDMGIFDRFDTTEATNLLEIVDPYEYRDRLNIPKFIVNSAGDDFFVMDSIQFYIDDLPGETYLRHVPNTDHYLTNAFDTVFGGLVPFYDAFLQGDARPVFSWSLVDDGSIRVVATDAPKAVYLWQASNPTDRDFRLTTLGATWMSSPLTDQDGGVYVGQVTEPASGWKAFFVELVYDNPFSQEYSTTDEFDYHFTTEMRVLPEICPFEADFNRDRITNLLDLDVLTNFWLSENAYRDVSPRRSGDGIVNLHDFSILSLHWLEDGN